MRKIDALSMVSALTGIAFAIFTNFNISTRIIILLVFIIFSLSLKLLELKRHIEKSTKQIQILQATLEDEKSKNSILTERYKEKNSKLESTEFYWYALNTVFLTAINGSARDRFQGAYEQYLRFTNFINTNKGE